MSTQDRIDRHLAAIRVCRYAEESLDAKIAKLIADRNVERAAAAEFEGRIAFLEGRKKGRNPHSAPLARCWNIGWEAERADTVEACRES